MNFTSIFAFIQALIAELPSASVVVSEVTGALKANSPLPQTTPASSKGPSQTLMAIQRVLNTYVKPTPLLKVDGLYGPKTEAAMLAGLKLAGLVS